MSKYQVATNQTGIDLEMRKMVEVATEIGIEETVLDPGNALGTILTLDIGIEKRKNADVVGKEIGTVVVTEMKEMLKGKRIVKGNDLAPGTEEIRIKVSLKRVSGLKEESGVDLETKRKGGVSPEITIERRIKGIRMEIAKEGGNAIMEA